MISGVPNNIHHKCCIFDPTLNEIDYMMWLALLVFSFTPEKVVLYWKSKIFEESWKNQYISLPFWMILPATPLLANYDVPMLNSSGLNWIFLFPSPQPPTMRKPLLPICLLNGTGLCGDACPILFSSWRLLGIMTTSQSSATKMNTWCKPLSLVVSESRK